jgi:ABC-type Fe3+/spermidine/putrescine transport system ATPase subunit
VSRDHLKEIYSNPKRSSQLSLLVKKNILNGVVVDFNKSKILVNIEKDEIEVANNNYTIAKNQEISLSIKSESIQISKVSSSKSKGAKNSITGKVTEKPF